MKLEVLLELVRPWQRSNFVIDSGKYPTKRSKGFDALPTTLPRSLLAKSVGVKKVMVLWVACFST